MKYDLHVHSNISDGSKRIEDILDEAKERGIDGIALTNHDTVEGLARAQFLGEEKGINVIRGIEISAYDYRWDKKVHVLGYSFDKTENIEGLCKTLREARHKNSLWQLQVIKSLGYQMDTTAILKKAEVGGVLYKQHIMEELIEKGYTDKIYGSLYRELFKGNGSARREIEYVSAIEAVQAIKRDGGLAILAHPEELDSYGSIGTLKRAGLDGVEINHPSQGWKEMERIAISAREYGLILTGGSDYHGSYGNSKLGQNLCPKRYVEIFK